MSGKDLLVVSFTTLGSLISFVANFSDFTGIYVCFREVDGVIPSEVVSSAKLLDVVHQN